jgi:hypothetical protein
MSITTIQTRRWLHISYTILVLATIGMSILEIARLAAEHAGVGLLPVTSVALSTIFAILLLQRRERTLDVCLVSHISLLECQPCEPNIPQLFFSFWTVSAILEAVKVSRLHLLEILFPSRDSKYPSSDKFLDNVVIVSTPFLLSVPTERCRSLAFTSYS